MPSDGWHAPNEKVELDLLMKGVETAAHLWGDLAAGPAGTSGPHRPQTHHDHHHRGSWKQPVTTWTAFPADRPITLSGASGIDRAAGTTAWTRAWLAAAWSHPSTRVFVVSGGQALIDDTPDGRTELVMTPAFEAPVTETHRYFLGQDEDGVAYFALQKDTLPGRMDQSARPAGLREAGLLLSPRDAGLLVHCGGPGELAAAAPHSARAAASAPSSPPPVTSAAARPAAPSTTRGPTPR
ncbi:hypothetical protein GCM10020221_26330 [Streptomyces thioluteus]|uniref:NADH pyrophosphatase-like N-terminal domain-containing protein n=1 Tax=Streptomyces thioluteus TaxID=66431 RepID=A0ABN3WXQ9_STRTU